MPGSVAVRRSIAIRVGEEWIEKWDYGYPDSIVDGQVKDEEPLKSAASDALMRAARLWGIGRELSRTLYMYGKLNERKRFAEPRSCGTSSGGRFRCYVGLETAANRTREVDTPKRKARVARFLPNRPNVVVGEH